jgi:hypothetical protein
MELSGGSDPSEQAKRVIKKTYDTLAREITTNSLRVLLALKTAGSNQSQHQIRSVVERMRERQEPDSQSYESNLEYRLKFLCLLGPVQMVGGREFALTHLGAAFIDKARDDRARYSYAFSVA